MIVPIDENTFVDKFFLLMAEVECGDHFKSGNPSHVSWVRKRISIHYLRGSYFFASFTEENTPIGFFALLIDEGLEGVPCFGQSSELLDIAVFSDYRGKGFGAELLRYAEEFARRSGVYTMGMFTSASDYEVIAFYGKHGYVPVATIPDVHGPGDEGKAWMRKILRK